MRVDGGFLVGKALANAGIEQAFVLCGGHIMPILFGMRDNGIETIDMRHECAAAYAAIAYSRATGKPSVVVTTAGPGVSNTTSGMMEADTIGVPLIHLGGAVKMSARDTGDLQDMDTFELMQSVTRWAKKITLKERIPEYISMAYRHATDSRNPGPVYLEFPTDLLRDTVEANDIVFPSNYCTDAIPHGDPKLVEKAAELLIHAERPAILIDEGARFSVGEHAASISELADYLKMPLGYCIMGNLCPGLFGNEMENPLLQMNATPHADVVLAMGCEFDFRHSKGSKIPADAKVIQVHTDSRKIGFNLRADLGIVGGIGPVGSQILDAVKNKKSEPVESTWVTLPGEKWPESLPGAFHSKGIPMHPARCAFEVAKFVAEEGSDWNIVLDGGEAVVWSLNAIRPSRPGQIHSTGANGIIGTGPGLGVGAWAANRKPVLWYTGDGSFGFYAMEMDTMEKLGIPCVCVISNDSAWGMIRLEYKHYHPEKGQVNTELAPMRAYEKMVSMWDGHGEAVKDPNDIIPAIRRAVANGKPSIINVEVDHESMSPFIGGYSAMVRADK